MKILYISAIVYGVLIVADLIWLGFVAKKFYNAELRGLLRQTPSIFTGLIVYIILSLGLTFFVINPSLTGQLEGSVFLNGILFGLVVYGIYNLTNLAVLKEWSIKLSIVDMVWGGFLCGFSSFVTYMYFK